LKDLESGIQAFAAGRIFSTAYRPDLEPNKPPILKKPRDKMPED
jgi:hypothetical protein